MVLELKVQNTYQGIENSGVSKHIFNHSDPEHLKELISKVDVGVPKIVALKLYIP